MVSKVYLTTRENLNTSRDNLLEELKKVFKKGERVAVKLHFGEPGSKTSFTPEKVKPIIDIMKESGIEPFLFDSPVMYPSIRDKVETYKKSIGERGYTLENLGCESIISNEYIERDGIQVCKTLQDADGMLVLTHFTGHHCLGIAGAIKNLGMGGVTKEIKAQIHSNGEPVLGDNCTLCGKCVESCPVNLISIENNKVRINYEECYGCSNCAYACPTKNITPKKEAFDKGIINSAKAVLESVKKYYCVTYLTDVTKFCDCGRDSGSFVSKDIGVLFSEDIVAIDKAGYDLIVANIDETAEMFVKSPMVHLELARDQGMGVLEYELEKNTDRSNKK